MGSLGTSSIRRIDRSKAKDIIEAIFDDGCCIITNFTDADTISRVNAETRPYLDADKPWEVRFAGDDDIESSATHSSRVTCSRQRLDDVPTSVDVARQLEKYG